MSSFSANGLTNKGRSLQAKAQAGAELHYTKFVIGDGQLVGQSISALTNVISAKKTIDVTRLKMTPPNQATIGFVLSNQDVTTGFFFREIGLYALDPDDGEILYYYLNAGDTADYIPAAGGIDVIDKNFDVLVYVGQAQKVTAIVDENLVYVTHKELEEAIDGINPEVPDASLTVAGKTMLSNATHGTREDVAATEKAVGLAFQAGNERKAELVAVLVSKGVAATTSETWDALFVKATALIKATGNAILADVLVGKKFSNDTGNNLTGTMPDLRNKNTVFGAEMVASLNVYAGNPNYAQLKLRPPSAAFRGYIDETGTMETHIYGLLPSTIKAGQIVGNNNVAGGSITGTFTSDATATAAQMLAGYVAYVQGQRVVGTMPNRSVEASHMPAIQFTSWPSDRVFLCPPHGYYDGASWVTAPALNLRAENIRNGIDVLGIVGTLVEGKRYASGQVVSDQTYVTARYYVSGTMPYNLYSMVVTGLAFKPRIIVISNNGWYNSWINLSDTIPTWKVAYTPTTTFGTTSEVGALASMAPWILTDNGFTAPTFANGKTHNWFAFE